MASPVDALKAGLARSQKWEEFSDCTIICGPYRFKVHKLIVSAHSEYFRTAFKADTFKEGKTGIIELKASDADSDAEDACDEPEIVKLMVEYFYHLDYLRTTPSANETGNQGSSSSSRPCKDNADSPAPTNFKLWPDVHLIEHAKVFAIAVKYQVDALRDLAAEKFQKAAQYHWDHEDFPRAVQVVWTSTADGVTQLRELVVQTLHDHGEELVKNPKIESLLRSMPGLACDLMKAKLASPSSCGNCGRTKTVRCTSCTPCQCKGRSPATRGGSGSNRLSYMMP